jgi:hypothetical protein
LVGFGRKKVIIKSVSSLPKNLGVVVVFTLLIWTGSAAAAARTTPFTPGQTLDPGAESVEPCGPTDANCFPSFSPAATLAVTTSGTYASSTLLGRAITGDLIATSSLKVGSLNGVLFGTGGTVSAYATSSLGLVKSVVNDDETMNVGPTTGDVRLSVNTGSTYTWQGPHTWQGSFSVQDSGYGQNLGISAFPNRPGSTNSGFQMLGLSSNGIPLMAGIQTELGYVMNIGMNIYGMGDVNGVVQGSYFRFDGNPGEPPVSFAVKDNQNLVDGNDLTALQITETAKLALGTGHAANTNSTNGEVDIRSGTTIPLYVEDTAGHGGGVALRLVNGSATCDHEPGSSSETVSCSSDARLKTDIVNAADQLPYLNSFLIRNFRLRSRGEEAPVQIGVVAQEVKPIHPELVKAGEDGYYKVELPSLWTVVKAIQELDAKLVSSASAFFSKIIRSEESHTQLLCVGDDSGAETCLTKKQLDALLKTL